MGCHFLDQITDLAQSVKTPCCAPSCLLERELRPWARGPQEPSQQPLKQTRKDLTIQTELVGWLSNQYLQGQSCEKPGAEWLSCTCKNQHLSVIVLSQDLQSTVMKCHVVLWIKFYCYGVISSHWCRFNGCSCATRVESNVRHHVAHKAANISFTSLLSLFCVGRFWNILTVLAAEAIHLSLKTFGISFGASWSTISAVP